MPPKKPMPEGMYIGNSIGVPRMIDPAPLLNLEEETRLAGIRARVHNGHAEHTDARFLLELLDRYMA
jgi:hypothetical protein